MDGQLSAGGRVVGELAKVWLANWQRTKVARVHRGRLRALSGSLPVPAVGNLPAGQPIALVDGSDFERAADSSLIEAGYSSKPRTMLYEGVDWIDNSWFQVSARQLAAVTGYRVTVSLYVSRAGDAGLHAHTDAWTGLVVQLRGSKVWRLGDQDEVLETCPGDILYLPTTVQHRVETPQSSTHAVFEVLTEGAVAG